MGDKPCEADCSVFGMLSQFLWNMPGSPYEQLLHGIHLIECVCFVINNEHLFDCGAGEFNNLKLYCERMRDTFWPDWDRCLLPPRISK